MADRMQQLYDPKTMASFLVGLLDLSADGTEYAPKVAVSGKLITLLPATTLNNASSNPTNGAAVTGLGCYTGARFKVTIAGRSLAGGGTVNLYVQGSFEGTDWFDIASLTQITNSAMPNGVYRMLVSGVGASASDGGAVQNDGALAVNTVLATPFGDRLRVKLKPASFGANDVVTITVAAWLVP